MLKRNIIIFITCCLVVGCQQSKKDSTKDMLEEKDFAGVIQKLENNAKTDDDFIALGKAYMGLSGLEIKDVIDKICISSNAEEGTSLITFTNSVKYDKAKCDIPLAYLNKATNYFMKAIGDKCTTDQTSLTEFEKDVCVYKGLSQTMEAVTTLNYIQEENKEQLSKKLVASSCAMGFAFNGVSGECSIFNKGDVYFKQSDTHYENIIVYTDGAEFEFLLSEGSHGTKDVVVTDGWCLLDDYSTRVDERLTNSYHICPVNINIDYSKMLYLKEELEEFNDDNFNVIFRINTIKKFIKKDTSV